MLLVGTYVRLLGGLCVTTPRHVSRVSRYGKAEKAGALSPAPKECGRRSPGAHPLDW